MEIIETPEGDFMAQPWHLEVLATRDTQVSFTSPCGLGTGERAPCSGKTLGGNGILSADQGRRESPLIVCPLSAPPWMKASLCEVGSTHSNNNVPVLPSFQELDECFISTASPG